MNETLDIIKPNGIVKNTGPNVLFLEFADSTVPIFKETRNKDYIKYGSENNYPEYLTHLFNKSAKHNAIVTGKAKYIFGKGYENGNVIVNRLNESLNDVIKKADLDIEIYGGFRLEVIWSRAGKVSEIYHTDYSTLRKAKGGGFFWKEWWKSYEDGYWKDNRQEEEFIPAFDPKEPSGSQIYEYNEYRPGVRFYPLPGYIGCNNYIETDIEISKYYLSAIRNGMMPSKMIQFFKGDPPDEKKKEIEKRFGKKFSGAENAGKFIMVFNDSNATKSVEINDLSATELDKQFIELNKTTQQEIFSGHNVTSPMLFGIKTEGQLGGNTELQTSYAIFKNTYAEPKANAIDAEVNWLMSYSLWPGEYKLQETDPVGIQFDAQSVISNLPKAYVYKELGIPEDMWNGETIAGAVPQQGGVMGSAVNDNIKNLSGRQHQGIMRIVRQYEGGKLARPAAIAMLKKGYGLDDDDVIAFLGEEPQPLAAASFEEQEDEIISFFDAHGDSKNDFEIVKSKKIWFASDADEDETIYIKEAFKTYDVTTTEAKIISLIKKDPLITEDVIAKAIGETEAFVKSKIISLTKRGYIESTIEKVGIDEILKRTITPDITVPPPTKTGSVQIFIKYSYEGPQDSRNRPFCAKMMALNRLYTRADIEKFSERFGYSVFDRRGGFWRHKDGTTTPYCRHTWKSNIVVKKGGENVS
jgi:hypothetical protein